MNSFSFAFPQRIAQWRQRVWCITRVARTDPAFVAASQCQLSANASQLTQLGWQAFHAQATERAQTLFRAALHHDPYTVSAWIGLSRTATSAEERRRYLQAALDLHQLVTHIDELC